MVGWGEIERDAPELAATARGFFEAHVHKTLATLRRDGSPRISGIEAEFADGELWIGMMWLSVKALDVRRDGRFALHSGSDDPPAWRGDAKLAGRLVEVDAPERPERSHRFRADIHEVSIVRLGEPPDHLVIESWHPGRGLTRRERR